MPQRFMKSVQAVSIGIAVMLVGAPSLASAECLAVNVADTHLSIDPAAREMLKTHALSESDVFRTMSVVARYETDGCWAGATGNFDGQWLSVGVMQWNFGQKTVQQMLKRFQDKFPAAVFQQQRDHLMPKYGKQLFQDSCRAIPIGQTCRGFLNSVYDSSPSGLKLDFNNEVDALFNFETMRQIQLDYFVETLTRTLDDLQRVFGNKTPAAWQVAWAIDLKTQQGHFPVDRDINRVRKELPGLPGDARKKKLASIVTWYYGLCSVYSNGVSNDCDYNRTEWDQRIDVIVPSDREETVHFTFLVSRGARGEFQADAFERRASIAFGKGSVHGSKVDFLDGQQ